MPKVWNKRDPNCPKDAVYVGRPSKWGNPYKIGGTYDKIPYMLSSGAIAQATFANITRVQSIILFRIFAHNKLIDEPGWIDALRGKDLVCWCAPLDCHADVLLELANLKYESLEE
jgi:hypothetical protein